MSTQDRAIRGGDAAQQEAVEGEAAAGGAVGGLSEAARLRVMQRRWIQRKANGAGGGGAASIPGGPGAPLGGGVQARMEKTLGADLSGVRVHTGGDSAEAAEALGARAFTVGSDVHFGRGEFAPGSREGDRLLAHELTHVVQGQKSGVQRKADAGHDSDAGHGDHEAGGHEVSEPGDAAEKEADAMGDHAADKHHGGGGESQGDASAHGAGDHGAQAGGATAGGKKVSPEQPKVAAAAPSVGRKIFRAPAAATQVKKPAAQAPASSSNSTPQKSKDELAKEKQVAQTTADMNALEAGDPKLALKVALALQSVDKDVAAFPKNEAVKAFQVFVNARKQLIINKCQEELAPLLAALDGLDEKSPASADKLAELKKSPVMEKWSRNAICGPFAKDKHPRLELFSKTLDKKLAANRDAIEKQKQHQKEEEEKKKAAAAHPAPAASASSSATPHKAGGAPNAGAAAASPTAASASSTPAAIATSSSAPAKTDAKTNAHAPAPPAPVSGPPAPVSAPQSTTSTPSTGQAAAPHKDAPAPPHADHKPAPAAAHTPAAVSGASSTPADATATPTAAHDAKAADAHTGGAADKTASSSSTATATTAQPAVAGPQGAQQTANQSDELKKQELALKKEVAIARVRSALVAAEDKWKGFGAALEVLNIGTMVAKGFLEAHGIVLPEEAISSLKDAIGAFGKGKMTNAQIEALLAVVEIQSIQTIDEIDNLFSEADIKAASTHLHMWSKKLSQEQALKQLAAEATKAKPAAPKGTEKPKAPTEEKKPEPEAEIKDSDAAASPSSSASEKDKSKDDGKKKGFGKRFKHAAEEAYETGVKNPVEAESDFEEKNVDFKIAAQQFGPVLDGAKTFVAVVDSWKAHFTELKAAKQAQVEAEKALETFLAEHGGKALPDSVGAVAKA